MRRKPGRCALVLAAAGALLALAATAWPQQRTLNVGSEQEFPPFAVGMTDGSADGFTVELWRAVARAENLAYEIRVRPLNEILDAFKAGEVDVQLNLAQSDERRKFADFSVTHVAAGCAVFVRKGYDRIRSEADLAGKSLIVIKGGLAHEYAVAQGWQAQLVLADTAQRGLSALAAGQHDAMLLSELAGLRTMRDQRIEGIQALDVPVGFSQRFAFAVRKGEADLLARINEGLALTKANGVYDQLHEKWFGVHEVRPRSWRELWPALAGVSTVLAVIFSLQYLRRRQRDLAAAARLRDSEERWKFALEGAGDGVWDADLVAGTALYSRRWKEILGYTDAEIGTDPGEWSLRIHPDDLDRVMTQNQACIDGASDGFVSEFRMRAKDGSWVWVLDRGKVVSRGSDGRAQRMIGTHTDISSRKSSEQALRVSEERLQRALEASRLALWDLDLTTGEVFLSDAWAEMLGGARRPTHTTFDDLAALVPPEDQTRIVAAMGSAMRGRTQTYSVEHRVRRTDGRFLWILSQGRVVERGANGRVHRAVGTNSDITERVNAKATQQQLESRLREAQKLEAIGTLASGIAHDFNNILAAILGNAALARQDIGMGHPALVNLEQINKAGQRARSLVKQILTFSRQQPGEFVSLTLQPIVEETVTLLGPLVGRNTALSLQLPEDALRVKGNATQLQQVLLNLGNNAWQALPGGAGRIEFGAEETSFAADSPHRAAGLAPGTYAHLWVRDNGCGMDEETRLHIFEPFFTTKPVGQGTGLGLAVVHGILESHGGVVDVDTAVAQGSTFHLYLPLLEGETLPAPPPELSTDAGKGQGQRVLYIDDDEVMALMVQSLLQRLGYRVSCTLDPREALAWIEQEPRRFDLVVTDFNMPAISGLEVTRRLSLASPGLPVVISSGYISDELRAQAAELRVRALVQKEHTLEELGAVVHSVLGGGTRRDAITRDA